MCVVGGYRVARLTSGGMGPSPVLSLQSSISSSRGDLPVERRPRLHCWCPTGSDAITPTTSRWRSSIWAKTLCDKLVLLGHFSLNNSDAQKLLLCWHHFLCDASIVVWAFLLVSYSHAICQARSRKPAVGRGGLKHHWIIEAVSVP